MQLKELAAGLTKLTWSSEVLSQLDTCTGLHCAPRHLLAADLHSLELCSRGCHQMVNRPALWQSLLVQRFGQLMADQMLQTTSHLSVLELKQTYVQLSRQIIPAPEMQAVHLAEANTRTDPQYLVHMAMADSTFGSVLRLQSVCWLDISASFQGVLPGEYQVLWRTRKDASRPVGSPQSEMHMSVSCEGVHSSADGAQEQTEVVHDLSHFNALPDEQWVDVPGGNILVADFAKVFVRLWCHSGEWKSGLSWDYVKLVDVNQPLSVQPSVQHAVQPAPAGVSGLAEDLRKIVDRCRLQ
ncbi:TPA: hypothetical protein ACH3X1_010755 [Trebouxia sp. C0004]